MRWVVDTSLLIDVAENDPAFGDASAKLLDSKAAEGLTICPISYVELAPVFGGDGNAQNVFLEALGIDWTQDWTKADTFAAHEAWNLYVQLKRAGSVAKRPIADLLIGAFASRFTGLLTRNAGDFQTHFPQLAVISPEGISS